MRHTSLDRQALETLRYLSVNFGADVLARNQFGFTNHRLDRLVAQGLATRHFDGLLTTYRPTGFEELYQQHKLRLEREIDALV